MHSAINIKGLFPQNDLRWMQPSALFPVRRNLLSFWLKLLWIYRRDWIKTNTSNPLLLPCFYTINPILFQLPEAHTLQPLLYNTRLVLLCYLSHMVEVLAFQNAPVFYHYVYKWEEILFLPHISHFLLKLLFSYLAEKDCICWFYHIAITQLNISWRRLIYFRPLWSSCSRISLIFQQT